MPEERESLPQTLLKKVIDLEGGVGDCVIAEEPNVEIEEQQNLDVSVMSSLDMKRFSS